MIDTKLKPCPFCGEGATIFKCTMPGVPKPYYVACTCGVRLGYDTDNVGTFQTKEEAAEAWNRRAEPKPESRKDALRKLLEEMKRMMAKMAKGSLIWSAMTGIIEAVEEEVSDIEYKEWTELLSTKYPLKPCPLCGSTPEWFREEAKDQNGVYWYGVMCPQCDRHGPLTMIAADQCAEVAANLWNAQTVEEIEGNFLELKIRKNEDWNR